MKRDAGSVVADLMKSGVEPENLEIVRPSLEDVYLQLVAAYEVSTGSSSGAQPTPGTHEKMEPVR